MINQPPVTSPLSEVPDLAPIVQEFVLRLPEQAEELARCYDQHDHENLLAAAHAFKGAAATYAFPDLSRAIAKLEEWVRANSASIGRTCEHLQDISDELDRIYRGYAQMPDNP